MTLQELYSAIDGDYDRVSKVLRIEKLIDKHIRKLPDNPIFSDLSAAAETMDQTALFEKSHAIKGVCSNLGLTKIAGLASEISEEFRPGKPRTMSDGEVREKVKAIDELVAMAAKEIRVYSAQ